jgi:hypothetical protein
MSSKDEGHVPSRKLSFDKFDRNAMSFPRFATQFPTIRAPPDPVMD